jgi:NADH-quinone oxidoreductase subunit M
MLTLALVGIPFLACIITFFMKGENAKRTALLFSIITFGIALFAFFTFKQSEANGLFRFTESWISSLGVKFSLYIDGISLIMVLLTGLLVPLIIYSSFNKSYDKPNTFYALIMLMQSALFGVFLAADGFLFYLFWELALIPIYFICLLWGGEDRGRITFKFFLYTLTGSLFMLVGLIFLYQKTATFAFERSWDLSALYNAGRSMSDKHQLFVFLCLFFAFAIKMPVFPFHTWQPDTYTNAPTQGTMLLSGIMLKMGTYGMIRWLLPLAPNAIAQYGHYAMVLAVIGIIYTSCIAIVMTDYKRLIAYSSIAHVGLICAGILSFNEQGLTGSIVQMLSHGINVVGLFLIADILLNKAGSRELKNLGGIRNIDPQFALLFLIIMLGSVALPLTNGFIGEFLLIAGVYQYSAWMAAFAGLTVILGAVYMLRSYQSIALGEVNSELKWKGLDTNEKVVLFVVAALVIGLGVYPKVITDVVEPAVRQLLLVSGKV